MRDYVRTVAARALVEIFDVGKFANRNVAVVEAVGANEAVGVGVAD